MNDRLLAFASGVGRVILVIVGFAIALGSIGLASVRGFCPEGSEPVALRYTLATIVEEESVDPELEQELEEPSDPSDPNAPEQPPPPAEDGGEDGACTGGVSRCLPPLVSSIVVLGDTTCHDEAGPRLRRILVPAFVGATALFGAAWWLRPDRLPIAPRPRR